MDTKKKTIMTISLCVVLIIIAFLCVKSSFFSNRSIDEPIKDILSNINNNNSNNNKTYKEAVTLPNNQTQQVITSVVTSDDIEIIDSYKTETNYPYEVAPYFEDDGSLVYDSMTLTELTNKLNKSLHGYMTNTGYFFADYTRRTGLDPYLAVSIVLLETGCKWTCSKLTVSCNNIGGLKGGNSCNGGSYRRYNTLGEGIDGFLDIIYKNYYTKGLTTPELMAPRYAQSSTWAEKVNNYINEVKSK